ncbi:uncharacterized protein LOC135466298 isoform X2 [Liolophura sinensis]|uniref:uncharacterized protein LOC135466298 isoform X2 n=1 Tax=Liolophura sinensis TaxID=3198878 RepID=UPI003158BD98
MIRLLPDSVSSHLRSEVAITSVTQCVEELVLNSLDAGANCVAVRVDMPCFKIQVVDNGSGIRSGQLDVIATRHYTSKCKGLMDLDNLEYFGFRGEALASICEMSAILDISTRVKQSSKTYCKLFHNGKAHPSGEAKLQRPSAGTTVTVHGLFNKRPVRKRMTNQILELELIKQRLEAIALMNPGVSMSLRNDETGNKILQTNKCNSTLGIFKQLYGAVKAANLSEVNCSKDKFRVSGYISSEGHFNKNLQFVYINTRLVLKTEIHKFLNKTLKKFYSSRKKDVIATTPVTSETSLLSSSPTKHSDKHGIFVVNISCRFNEYDITFDPAKTLVEFKDWETVLSTVREFVEEFQQQFSVNVGPVGTTLDAEASSNCTQFNIDNTSHTVEPDSPKHLQMSTIDTENSLRSEVIKSSQRDATVTVSSSPHEVMTEKAKEDSDLEIKENNKDNFQAFPDLTKTCVSPVNSTFSSDTSSTLTCTSGSVKVSADEEDPLCAPHNPSGITLHSKSPDLAGEADDSGIDPGMTADTTTGYLDSSVCPQSVRLRKPTVKTFQSIFKQRKSSNLSSLRAKQSKGIQGERNPSAVTCKLKELRESLGKPSGDQQKCNIYQVCPKSSILSSLKKLRETVEQLQSKGKTDKVVSCETVTSTCMPQSSASMKEADIHNRSTSNTLAGKKRSGLGKETTSSKLARLAGIGSREVDGSLQKHSSASKVSLTSESSGKLCDVSLDSGSARNPDLHPVLTCSASKQGCQSSAPVNPSTEPVIHSGTGRSGEFIQNSIFPVISRHKSGTAKVNQFMTTESLITTVSALSKNSSSRSEVSCEQAKCKVKIEEDFAFNKHHPLETTASCKLDNSSQLDYLDPHNNFSMSETIKVQHFEGGTKTTPGRHNVMKVCSLESSERSVMNGNSVTCDEKIQKEFCSQDGKIRLSQESYNMVDSKDVFKSYQCDSKRSLLTSIDNISSLDAGSEYSGPGRNHDKKVWKPEPSTDVEMSQGFDFRTMKPIVNSPGNLQKDDSSLFETVDVSSAPGSDAKTFFSPDIVTSVNERDSDLMPPDKDLIDLLITPSPSCHTPVCHVSPCPNQPGLLVHSPGKSNQCSLETGICSHLPTSETKLYSENGNSFTTISPVLSDKINNCSSDNVMSIGLVETCIQTEVPEGMTRVTAQTEVPEDMARVTAQTEVPEDMARVTAETVENKSSDVSLKLELPSADCIRDTIVLTQDKSDDNCVDSCLLNQNSGDALNTQVDKKTGYQEHQKIITPLNQREVEYLLTNMTEDSDGCDSKTDEFLIRNHPMSGKKIVIHPLTGHSLDEAGWELWLKQNNNTEHKDQELLPKKKLLSHDLAYSLSKPSTSNAETDELSTNVDKTSGEIMGDHKVDELWADHVTNQCEEDSIKWRNPSSKALGDESKSLADLFEEWDNPVFSVPEQDITTAEMPDKQKGAGKVQGSVHQCRFTKNMLCQVQVMGQVDDKFIACLMRTKEKNLSADGNLLVLVDQHAAHERVRLEQLTKDSYVTNSDGNRVIKSSAIIPPLELRLTEELVRVMTAYQAKFEQLGVMFSTSDKRDTVFLKSAPSCFIEREASEIKRGRTSVVMEMIEGFIVEQVELLKSTNGALATLPGCVHKLLCSQACHGAIKFGDSLTLEECEDLLKSLSLCDLPFQCAHGRPSVMPLLNFDHFKAKFPQKCAGKPQLWRLRPRIEESIVEESLDQKTESMMDVDMG